MKLLITAGPTVEPIDPVRYLSNRSSGKMGYAIANAAVHEGCEVILISGPTQLEVPHSVTFINIETALELESAVQEYLPSCDAGIFTAAVSDYRVKNSSPQKLKKDPNNEEFQLSLIKNPDILANARRYFSKPLVGFAAETENLVENAQKKLSSKGCDLIVANDVSRDDIGFNTDENQATFIYPDRIEPLEKMSKDDLGLQIVGATKELIYLSTP